MRYTVYITYSVSNSVQINILQMSGNKKRGSVRTGDCESNMPMFGSKEQIREATVTLLRRLITLTQTLGPLPTRRDIMMKLLYHPEVTPNDYAPAFFQTEFVQPRERTDLETLHIGSVATPYHSLSFSYVPFYSLTILPMRSQHTTRRWRQLFLGFFSGLPCQVWPPCIPQASEPPLLHPMSQDISLGLGHRKIRNSTSEMPMMCY